MRILVLGGTGMLGHVVLRYLAAQPQAEVSATVRTAHLANVLPDAIRERLHVGVDANDIDALTRTIAEVRPDVVINCIGIVKQVSAATDPVVALSVNSLLPHRLQRLCAVAGARLVQVSTDCVFAGTRGLYTEADVADATDLYGRSKLLGEVDAPNAITLRTSIIGPEIGSRNGLLGWFLGTEGTVRGFTQAIFSGLTTCELARVIWERVLPATALRGVHHVASAPITKHDLLLLLREAYGHRVDIVPDDVLRIDRSLDGNAFARATGYVAPTWSRLVTEMRDFG